MDESLVEIKQSSIAGRGVFAKIDLKPYTRVLLSLRPLLHAVDAAHVIDTCSWCFRTNTPPTSDDDLPNDVVIDNKACTGCKYLRFCSKVWNQKARNSH
jgi:hypothetical protein